MRISAAIGKGCDRMIESGFVAVWSMTGYPVPRCQLPEYGSFGPAALIRARTARMKRAAQGRIRRTRRLAMQGCVMARALDGRVGDRNGCQQCVRVRVHGMNVEIGGGSQLHESTQVHH